MAPGGVNLAWATTTPTVSLLMWPITATAGPIAAFNLSLILAPPASAWATFILARRLTGKFWPALLAGFVFGFCAYEISHEASGQPNLDGDPADSAHRLPGPAVVGRVTGRRGFLIWMALALAAEFYTFLEAFADLTLIAPFALVIGYVVAARETRPKVVRLTVDLVIAYVGSIVLAAPYLYAALVNKPKSFHQAVPQFWVDVAGVVVPRTNRLLGMKWLAPVPATSSRPPSTWAFRCCCSSC